MSVVPAGSAPVASHSNSSTVTSSASLPRGNSFSVNLNSATNGVAASNGNAVANGGDKAPAVAPAAPAAAGGVISPPATNGAACVVSPPPASNGVVGAPGAHGAVLVNKPSFLEDPKTGYRFFICDAPNDQNLPAYLDAMKKRQVVALARVCDPTYSTATLLAQNIPVVEVPFADGDPPPQAVIDRWLALVDQVFNKGANKGSGVELHLDGVEKPAIAVHCVAGLGRAPVLVAIALVESGMEPFDAIAFIRKKRRGAINARQLKFIEQYQPKNRAKGCCAIQ